MSRLSALLDRYRNRVVDSTTELFAHAPYPLADTMAYPGDPGLCGPDSVTWPVIGDAAAFIGGVRALLIQAAHPEVVAGVSQHSRYRLDPLGRLSRTSAYVTATSFGAMPEVEAAVALVRGAHRPVRGESHRGRRYSAGTPELAAWVSGDHLIYVERQAQPGGDPFADLVEVLPGASILKQGRAGDVTFGLVRLEDDARRPS